METTSKYIDQTRRTVLVIIRKQFSKFNIKLGYSETWN